MRVGLVSADVGPSEGAAATRQHVAHVAAELSRLGHDVRVYERRQAASAPPVTGYRLESVPVGPARATDPGELVPVVPAFGRWLAERWAGDWTPDVVHGHHWIGGLAAASAARTAGVPVVQTFHSIGAERQRQLGRDYRGPGERIPLERALTRAVDMAVAQSTDEAEELGRMGLRRASVELVPAGVDVDAFSPEGDAAPRDRRRRILSVNGFGPGSGQADLIRAMRLVGDAELVIAGAPGDEGKVRDLARASGVEDQVTLVGQVPHEQMPRWYRSADLVAFAMRYATRGPGPLEAMACGVPVVGYALGGIADTVVDEVTGRLVKPGDVRGLGMTLRRLLADEPTRFAFRHAAVDRVRCRYTWDRTAGALERLYTRVLGRRGRLAPA
jgi:glycosyltransferase involved in cell wall biosynthesis